MGPLLGSRLECRIMPHALIFIWKLLLTLQEPTQIFPLLGHLPQKMRDAPWVTDTLLALPTGLFLYFSKTGLLQ